jgi:Endoribonuclease XendoU
MSFLAQKGVVTSDPQSHRELLKTIWFNLYSRGMGKIGSSGFEHVFLSEVKNEGVMGLHNWIYMYEAEKQGDLDYKGWMKKIDLGNVRMHNFVARELPHKSSSSLLSFATERTNRQGSIFAQESDKAIEFNLHRNITGARDCFVYSLLRITS